MEDYITKVKQSENKDYIAPRERINSERIMRLMHGTIGIVTEAAELLDAFKRHLFYGAELDEVNVKEELGDIEWYAAIIRDELNVTQDEIQETNIRKLVARYNKQFSEDSANNRNLDTERQILEE